MEGYHTNGEDFEESEDNEVPKETMILFFVKDYLQHLNSKEKKPIAVGDVVFTLDGPLRYKELTVSRINENGMAVVVAEKVPIKEIEQYELYHRDDYDKAVTHALLEEHQSRTKRPS